MDLANFLNSMGADIRGAGTDTIKIRGVGAAVRRLLCHHSRSDEAGTYMASRGLPPAVRSW